MLVFVFERPGFFFCPDEAVDGRMKRGRNASALRFASDGAAQEIHFRRQLMAYVIKHRWRMVGHRADLIHRPGILVKLDAGCFRDALPEDPWAMRSEEHTSELQ